MSETRLGSVSEFAPAKVNLCLHVTGRRADGYHLLDSVVAFAGVGDVVTASHAHGISLTIGGTFGGALSAGPDNLVLRAAQALSAVVPGRPGAALHLDKTLPVASGIGGGSADAAATLRALARLWNVAEDMAGRMAGIALALGADVPVCLGGQPARMRGVGEILEPISLPPHGLVLVNPGQEVATASVFRSLAERFVPSQPLHFGPICDAGALAGWLDRTTNDLQGPAIGLCPVIQTVLDELHATQGCLMARMSGSGATCFALYSDGATARRAAESLARPEWWCWGG